MIIRQLKATQFNKINMVLMQETRSHLHRVSYDVDISVNGSAYLLRIQPEKHCKLAALQACKICCEEDNPSFELITNGNFLSVLLELFIYQNIS